MLSSRSCPLLCWCWDPGPAGWLQQAGEGCMVDGPGNPGNCASPVSGAGLQDQHSSCLVGPMHLIVFLSHAEGSSRAQLRHPDKRQVSKMASAQCPKDFRKPDPSVCPLHKPSLKTAMSSGHHAPSVRLRAAAPVFLRDWAELLLSQ